MRLIGRVRESLVLHKQLTSTDEACCSSIMHREDMNCLMLNGCVFAGLKPMRNKGPRGGKNGP